MRRHYVEGGVDGLHPGERVGDPPIREDLGGVPHLDDDVVLRPLLPVRDAGDLVGHPEILGQDGDLESADLVGDMAVPGDGVRR